MSIIQIMIMKMWFISVLNRTTGQVQPVYQSTDLIYSVWAISPQSPSYVGKRFLFVLQVSWIINVYQLCVPFRARGTGISILVRSLCMQAMHHIETPMTAYRLPQQWESLRIAAHSLTQQLRLWGRKEEVKPVIMITSIIINMTHRMKLL